MLKQSHGPTRTMHSSTMMDNVEATKYDGMASRRRWMQIVMAGGLEVES